MKHTKALISILILVTSLFGQTTDGKTAPPMKFQDISEGGIIDYNKGKAALIRDPDVGGYIMLWQPAR